MDRHTRTDSLSARDDEYRKQMRNASDALLYAMLMELEGMGVRNG